MGSAQPIVLSRAQAPCDAAVKYCLAYLGSSHPEFELEGGTRSVVSEATPCIVYAPVDHAGLVGSTFVVDAPPPGIRTSSFGFTPGRLPLR